MWDIKNKDCFFFFNKLNLNAKWNAKKQKTKKKTLSSLKIIASIMKVEFRGNRRY